VFRKLFCSITTFSLSTHRCHPSSLIKQAQGSILKNFIWRNRYTPSWSTDQHDGWAWWPS